MTAIWRSIDAWPLGLGVILHIYYLWTLFLCVWMHVEGIRKNHKKWKPKEKSRLTYSYFGGTGFYQWEMFYRYIFACLWDEYYLPSIAGFAEKVYLMSNPNGFLDFLLSVAYYPLKGLSYPERLFRYVVGSVYVFITGLTHWLILAVLYGISMALLPIWKVTDHSMRVEQHCPHCFATFRLPTYICPTCGCHHNDLVPGVTGLMYARCECGEFLPTTIAMGKNKLTACCPSCYQELAASNVKEFSLLLTGGNTSGKTAYLSAFQHVYRETVNHLVKDCQVEGTPTTAFSDLENIYKTGKTIPSSETSVSSYSFIHSMADGRQYNMVVYDIPDEVLLADNYERNPLNFAYADGFILMFDPFSEHKVREKSEQLGDAVNRYQYSSDSLDDIVVSFIQQFSRLANRSSSKMNNTPVAVVITKADARVVKFSLRDGIVAKLFEADPEKYENDISKARSEVYRNYLIEIGLSNAINNLESVFSNVRYFTVSAMGHFEGKGSFQPKNVINPVAWIAKQNENRLADILKTVQQYTSPED